MRRICWGVSVNIVHDATSYSEPRTGRGAAGRPAAGRTCASASEIRLQNTAAFLYAILYVFLYRKGAMFFIRSAEAKCRLLPRSLVSLLEQRPGQARLANYGSQRANLQFRVIGHRHRRRPGGSRPLHRRVASLASHLGEAVVGENAQTSDPDSTLSRPNVSLEMSHKDAILEPRRDL